MYQMTNSHNVLCYLQARHTRQNSGGGGCKGLAKIRQRGGGAIIFYFLRD